MLTSDFINLSNEEHITLVKERLPFKLRRAHLLCKDEDHLYEEAYEIVKYMPNCPFKSSKELKDYQHGVMSSAAYLQNYNKAKWGGKTFGMAVDPYVLLNVADILHPSHLIWTYIHEATHLLGKDGRHKRYLNEAIAIRGANYWCNRLGISPW